MAPDRLAVRTPETIERPAWQLLARIPLALAEMDQAPPAIALAQTVIEIGSELALGSSQRRGVPFFAVGIVDGNKRRLPADGQPHVASRKVGIDIVAKLFNGPPLCFGIGLGDPRRFPDARDRHFVGELHLALVDGAGNRSGGCWLGRAGEREMSFSRK